MAEFMVRWDMVIDADSPVEAAQKALTIQRDPGSIATVFEVTSPDGTTTSVDLEERRIEWTPVPGPDRSERYVEGTYRRMHCELFESVPNVINWSFYDENSEDFDVAVMRGSAFTRDDAERELIDYIDGYVAEER